MAEDNRKYYEEERSNEEGKNNSALIGGGAGAAALGTGLYLLTRKKGGKKAKRRSSSGTAIVFKGRSNNNSSGLLGWMGTMGSQPERGTAVRSRFRQRNHSEIENYNDMERIRLFSDPYDDWGYYEEDERLFSTGNDELDDILEEVYYSGLEDGYDYFQREFAESEDEQKMSKGEAAGLGAAGIGAGVAAVGGHRASKVYRTGKSKAEGILKAAEDKYAARRGRQGTWEQMWDKYVSKKSAKEAAKAKAEAGKVLKEAGSKAAKKAMTYGGIGAGLAAAGAIASGVAGKKKEKSN